MLVIRVENMCRVCVHRLQNNVFNVLSLFTLVMFSLNFFISIFYIYILY